MKQRRSNEEGHVIIEATIIFPIMILMVVALFYAAIYLCQRANLQANLQNALVYFKNTQSDTFVGLPGKEMVYTVSDDTKITGTSFAKDQGLSEDDGDGLRYKFPYRSFFRNRNVKNENAFVTFFRYMTGTMFFDTGENVEVHYETKNYVLFKQVLATATQRVQSPLSFSMVGVNAGMTISAQAEMTISDGDEFVRNIDFIADLISNSKFGEMLNGLTEKIGNIYDNIKGVFNIE
ncbi:MAG: hypothetical protein K6E62_02900 [Lachnospiraceae bacterium]|nr:hypothetical protein [Lachnospiraceae bacterium]